MFAHNWLHSRARRLSVLLQEIGIQPHEEESAQEGRAMIRQVMELKLVHLMAFFILVYVGAEVTIGWFHSPILNAVLVFSYIITLLFTFADRDTGGWIVTFVLEKRGAGAGAGYVSSGFFGGLTIGRMGLIWVNNKVRII